MVKSSDGFRQLALMSLNRGNAHDRQVVGRLALEGQRKLFENVLEIQATPIVEIPDRPVSFR